MRLSSTSTVFFVSGCSVIWKLSINQRSANVIIRDSGCDGMDYIALEISSLP
jgi:hypothetical protein